VIVDGAWNKRSYKNNYNALSAWIACIIGTRTKKVLYSTVKNKFCELCLRYFLHFFDISVIGIYKWLSGPACYENLSNLEWAALYVVNSECHIFRLGYLALKPDVFAICIEKYKFLVLLAVIKRICIRNENWSEKCE
jgi:hypothetical protein